MYPKDYDFPSIEELTMPELKIGTPSLLAAAFHLGKYCQTPNDEFMLCKKEERDPRKCIIEGKDVTKCSFEFFSKLKKSCLEEFEQYANCIYKSSANLSLARCRKTQGIFDQCVLEHFGQERPEFGYFCRPRVLDTKRPKPEGYKSPEFPGKAEDPVYEDGRKTNRNITNELGMQ